MNLFKSRKTLSLDLGSSEIKVVEGRFSKKGIDVISKFSLDLPKGIYEDGVIHNFHQLGEILESGFKERRVSTDNVNGVINSSQIITREITMPKVPEKEIEAILSYQMEDYIPIRPEDYIVQCIILDTIYDDSVEKYNLLLVGIPKEIVESHLKLFENLNLKGNVLDFQGNAITKLVNHGKTINGKHSLDDKIVALVDIGYTNTKLSLIEDGNIKITRILDLGIGESLEDIKRDLSLDKQGLNSLLKNLSLSADYDQAAQEYIAKERIMTSLRTLVDNVEMVFRYYRTRHMSNNIDLILLQGGILGLEGIDNIFNDYFGTETIKFESIDSVNLDEPMWKYGNAIGGLIRMNEV